MIQPELRSELPALPGKDDVFTKMGMLFIETYEQMLRLESLLDVSKPHIKDYIESNREYIENIPMRYLEIIKEYQEWLFAQPVRPEDDQEGIEE